MNLFSSNANPALIIAVILISIWQFSVKGIALWRASQLKQRNWFIVLFVLMPFNDLAIVELVYLFYFAKKRLTISEVRSWFVRR